MAVEVTRDMVREARRLASKSARHLYQLQDDDITNDPREIDINNARANSWYAQGIADTLDWILGSNVAFPSFLTSYKPD